MAVRQYLIPERLKMTKREKLNGLIERIRIVSDEAANWISDNIENKEINDFPYIDSFAIWKNLPQGDDYWRSIEEKMVREGLA